MANTWLRLWHDMPNDPKWRTIARASKQPISAVMAVYIHVLVCASNADERGRTQGLNNEDIASALDLEVEQVDAILSAMQGRVLDGDSVSGWEKRQPKREDGAAERAKAWREAKKNASERTANAEERPDKDKDTDTENKNLLVRNDVADECPHKEIIALYHKHLPALTQVRSWTEKRAKQLKARWREEPKRQNLEYWEKLFQYIAESDWLMGRSIEWQADLEWITKSENFVKIIEGKYHKDA